MLIILLGPPAAGKGTQAAKLAKHLNISHISTGDILRQSIRDKTPLGKIALLYINKGELVPDGIITAAVKERLSQKDCSRGALLDGFPRTLPQAEGLDAFAPPYAAIDIDVDKDILLKRVTGRRVCAKCGKNFHADSFKGISCDCGGSLYTREDDTEEVFKTRLDNYQRLTAPLKQYYRNQGKLKTVDGEGTQDEVFDRIIKALKLQA